MNHFLTLGLQVLSLLFKNYTFVIRHGLAKGLKRRFGSGFRPKFSLTPEEELLMQLDFRGRTIFDIGGYIGLYAMFFARGAGENGRVITFEPNPANCEEILHHIALNGITNIELKTLAVGREQAESDFNLDSLSPARGTLLAGESETNPGRRLRVQIDSIDRMVDSNELPLPDFVKIDVEGVELEVLQGMEETLRKTQPELLIEVHGLLQEDLVELLTPHGYVLWHVESKRHVSGSNLNGLRDGHLYCQTHKKNA